MYLMFSDMLYSSGNPLKVAQCTNEVFRWFLTKITSQALFGTLSDWENEEMTLIGNVAGTKNMVFEMHFHLVCQRLFRYDECRRLVQITGGVFEADSGIGVCLD